MITEGRGAAAAGPGRTPAGAAGNALTGAIAAGDDGVHAETALLIDAGTVDVTRSNEGIESANITIAGGTTSIVSSDDGLNASGSTTANTGGQNQRGGGGGGEQVGPYKATISGGTLTINAEGDGFDSNGTAEITGGTVVVNGPVTRGNGALDVNGSFTISGGVLLAAGSAGMAVAPGTDSAQGWLSATLTSTVAAGTTIHITAADGTVLATFVTTKTVQNIVYSGPNITTGSQYKIYTGGTATGTSIGGLAQSGTLGSGAAVATVTAGQAPAGTGFGRR
ncbi:carbohydrate-binding domain-containing protein [Dactylosporangium sp. CA-139114]|uniref:carbohydrate-binding domain-containing protein n=1 Tax=Dactylosporangium sp. CA-139114 TaxID=3239931 RepID=UPI003D96EF39